MAASEIVLTVLYGVMGWGALEGFNHGRKLIKERRPLTKLFPFAKSNQVWIVLSEISVNKQGEFFDKASPIDGVYSFDDLSDNLRRIGLSRKQFDTCFSSDLEPSDCEDDLILIGGYENNKVSKRMNELYRKERHYFLENNTIIERGGYERSWGVVVDPDDDKRILKDYCLVTKIHNPFCSDYGKSWILAFEGVREFGTWGAVRFWNERIFKEFQRLEFKVKRSDPLELVMEIDVDHKSATPQVKLGGIKSAYWKGIMKK